MNINLNIILNMYAQLPYCQEHGTSLVSSKVEEIINSVFNKYSISKQSMDNPNLFLSEDGINKISVDFNRKGGISFNINDSETLDCKYLGIWDKVCDFNKNYRMRETFRLRDNRGYLDCQELYDTPNGQTIRLDCGDGLKIFDKYLAHGSVTVSSPMTDYGVIAGLVSTVFCAYKSYSAYSTMKAIDNDPHKAPGVDGAGHADKAYLWGAGAIISLIGTAIQTYNVVSNPQYS